MQTCIVLDIQVHQLHTECSSTAQWHKVTQGDTKWHKVTQSDTVSIKFSINVSNGDRTEPSYSVMSALKLVVICGTSELFKQGGALLLGAVFCETLEDARCVVGEDQLQGSRSQGQPSIIRWLLKMSVQPLIVLCDINGGNRIQIRLPWPSCWIIRRGIFHDFDLDDSHIPPRHITNSML